jgi:hypothetical protein
MNQRILAMAKQCGLCDEDGDFYGAKNTAYQQFAELIVRECADIADGLLEDNTGSEVMFRIKEHFGVES